jgi:hypothetical protein
MLTFTLNLDELNILIDLFRAHPENLTEAQDVLFNEILMVREEAFDVPRTTQFGTEENPIHRAERPRAE